MTRFKDLKRIESAIRFKSKSELQWAERYCENRLSIPGGKKHGDSRWRDVLRRVRATLDEIKE